MPISVVQAINALTGERIQIRRFTGPSTYVDGLEVPAPTRIIPAFASVQPIRPEEIVNLSGLERHQDIKTFYVNKPVVTSDSIDGEEADVLLWKGKGYRAMRVHDWASYGYNAVIGARVE